MADPTPPPTSGPRWVRWLLVLSLALNLMIVGIIGGWVLKGGKHAHDHPSKLDRIGGPLTRALSQDDRRVLGRDLRKAYRERSGDRGAQRAIMQALVTALRSAPFNREAVAGHMAAQRDVLEERMALGQNLLLDRLAAMTAAERADYADRLERAVKRRSKKTSQ